MDTGVNIPKFYRVTVEPVLFSFVFTAALSDGVITNLLLRQACWLEGGTEECKGKEEILAQQRVSYIDTFKTLIETLLPAFLSLFIGPWSDSNGRKIILVVPIVGHILTYCTWAAFSLNNELNPTYLLFSTLGVACTGGYVLVYIACFCYLADVTNEDNSVIRMGIAEASLNIGELLGFFLCPYIFRSVANGYLLVFLTNSIILTINALYIIFCLPETIQVRQDQRKKLFRLDHLKDTYRALMQPRPCYGRPIILLACFVSFLSIIIVFGESAVKYLSVMKEFHWDIEQFTLYNTITLAAVFFCSSTGLWIGSKMFKVTDEKLLLSSEVLRVLSGILMAISPTASIFYTATLFASFKSFTGPLVRSQLTLIVSKQDVGKVFAFLSSLEAITPQIGVPLYNTVYASIVASYPLAIYFLSALICTFASIIVGVIMILKNLSTEQAYSLPPENEQATSTQ